MRQKVARKRGGELPSLSIHDFKHFKEFQEIKQRVPINKASVRSLENETMQNHNDTTKAGASDLAAAQESI